MKPVFSAVGILACVLVVGACDGPQPEPLSMAEVACQDTTYSSAYMVRLPHEPHAAERCLQIVRRASAREAAPDVAPFLSSPIRK